MYSNHNITAQELWRQITSINTTQEWMELTHGFSLFTIYHHCRILQDPEKIETYQCMIRKEYPKSLEKFDEKDPLVVCYMMMGNGNLRRSSNPSFFDRLVDEGVRSARNDGPYTTGEFDVLHTHNAPALTLREKIDQVVPLMENGSHWFCVYRALVDKGIHTKKDYAGFVNLIKGLYADELPYPINANIISRLDVDSWAKPVSEWDISNAPRTGNTYPKYVEITTILYEIL